MKSLMAHCVGVCVVKVTTSMGVSLKDGGRDTEQVVQLEEGYAKVTYKVLGTYPRDITVIEYITREENAPAPASYFRQSVPSASPGITSPSLPQSSAHLSVTPRIRTVPWRLILPGRTAVPPTLNSGAPHPH